MSTFLQDFKAFTLKGNVVDMAVGVIIGGAFGKIVSSLVADIIMPPIGLLVGGVNFTELKVIMKEAILDAEGNVVTEAVTWNYGNFIQSLFDFIIIAFSIFMIIRFITKMSERNKKEEEEATAEPAAPSNEEVLLTEIRDLLAKK